MQIAGLTSDSSPSRRSLIRLLLLHRFFVFIVDANSSNDELFMRAARDETHCVDFPLGIRILRSLKPIDGECIELIDYKQQTAVRTVPHEILQLLCRLCLADGQARLVIVSKGEQQRLPQLVDGFNKRRPQSGM